MGVLLEARDQIEQGEVGTQKNFFLVKRKAVLESVLLTSSALPCHAHWEGVSHPQQDLTPTVPPLSPASEVLLT